MSKATPLKIALGVSLALNLAVAGFLAGAAYNSFRAAEEGKHITAAGPTVWALSEQLGAEDRAVLQAVLRNQGESLGPTLAEVRQARREAITKLAAPQYDGAGVASALARARAGETKARAQVDAALLELMPKLKSEDRATIADAVVRGRIGRPMDAAQRPTR